MWHLVRIFVGEILFTVRDRRIAKLTYKEEEGGEKAEIDGTNNKTLPMIYLFLKHMKRLPNFYQLFLKEATEAIPCYFQKGNVFLLALL